MTHYKNQYCIGKTKFASSTKKNASSKKGTWLVLKKIYGNQRNEFLELAKIYVELGYRVRQFHLRTSKLIVGTSVLNRLVPRCNQRKTFWELAICIMELAKSFFGTSEIIFWNQRYVILELANTGFWNQQQKVGTRDVNFWNQHLVFKSDQNQVFTYITRAS